MSQVSQSHCSHQLEESGAAGEAGFSGFYGSGIGRPMPEINGVWLRLPTWGRGCSVLPSTLYSLRPGISARSCLLSPGGPNFVNRVIFVPSPFGPQTVDSINSVPKGPFQPEGLSTRTARSDKVLGFSPRSPFGVAKGPFFRPRKISPGLPRWRASFLLLQPMELHNI